MNDQQNEQEISAALRAAQPVVLAAGPREAPTQVLPVPHDVWELRGGIAWVYLGEGNSQLTRPVILADGFNSGPSSLGLLWAGLDFGDYGFLSALRAQGRDVILLGFHERSASILDNAQTAREAILRAIYQRVGDATLAVGGFSMGGLVTRYALAKMESQRIDHQTALYWSYDSPHRGAWVPLALQAFAHYTRKLDPRFSDQMNSPASRQLLWRHIAEWDAKPDVSTERTDFLDALESVGNWPRRPRTIGVANGVANGVGNGIEAGALAFVGQGLAVVGSKLNTQSAGDNQLVAQLRVVTIPKHEVRTSGIPAIDGAPGGTLDGFGILADTLNAQPSYLGLSSEAPIRSHCFVPAISAVAIRDIGPDTLYADIDNIDPNESELDEFRLASQNEGHTRITEELCSWIIERLM